ncbi:hypothetical protein VC83_00208 [Pseudogymnoascus destructans]|uniref:Uncharacterized protein n=1 Tax=Pseudogymnoascus destructans TaxID=655981 RepID=A0A177AP15_9PEZI|nr:uncharacterized protein VC83_00208 [Pseudogymnoascus destructans]OAF62924.1 hypothetical protein VC83_00208 [Pseudogymnoascus destructans]
MATYSSASFVITSATSRTIIAALLIDPDVASAHDILVNTPVPSVSTPTSTPTDIAVPAALGSSKHSPASVQRCSASISPSRR